ncbi:hypothetical protein Pmar_PMAR003528 [Perkinsus marinus ATCC 50983]|uniref:RNase NYN domain-containing protein n=1 Tax=Perkinsus marinus (strain ATCC 50983 / TXsc) TaxID=423536 RepID=C5KHK3_PERM5|nr:hypothetical protein Pmar_PMAR003528 [Perkinsus marinus ATCC 50983]EER16065.1 hypothetical protein Pmar_PMAR003528 [Perkinsus marinus ATCC 50983]|eukprot:XP_002784269.1 hypothetical protein Pmar_PMAR003528 [Perkinsus marinus ATCC 50983]
MNDGNISTSEDVDDLTSRVDSKRPGGISRRPMSPIERLDYCEAALTSTDKGRFMEAVKGKAVGKIWKIVYDQLSDTMNALRALDRENGKMYAELQEQLRLQAETVRMYFMDLRRRIVEARGDDEAEALRLLDGRLEVVFGDLDRYVGTFVEPSHLNLASEHYERCLLLLGPHESPAVCLLSITAGLQRRRLSKICYDLLRHNPQRDGPDHLISKMTTTMRHLAEVPEPARPFAKSILTECISSLRREPLNVEPLKLAGLVMVDEPARASPGTWHWLVLLIAAFTLSVTEEERGRVKSLILSIGEALALEPAIEASRLSNSALWCSLLLCLQFMGSHWHGDADVDGIVKAHCAEYAVVFGDLDRYVGTFVEPSHLNLASEHYERCLLLLGPHESPAVCLLSITAGLQRRRLSKICYDLLRHNPQRDGPDHLISKMTTTMRHLAEVPEPARPFAKSILTECISSLRREPLNVEPLKLAGLVMVDEPARASPGTWHWLVLLIAAFTLSVTEEERGRVKSLILSIGEALALEPAIEASRLSNSALWCSLLLCLQFMGSHWHGDADVDGIVKAHCAEYAVSAAEEPWASAVETDIFCKSMQPAKLSRYPSATMASRLVEICLHISTKPRARGVLSIPKELNLKKTSEPTVKNQLENSNSKKTASDQQEKLGRSRLVLDQSSSRSGRRADRWGNLLLGDSVDRNTARVRCHAHGRDEMASEADYKPLVLIDGPNVANRHGGQQFTCKGLQICVDYYVSRGHEVLVFLPDYLVNRNELFKLRNAQKMRVQTMHGIKAAPTHIPVDNIGFLLKLQTQGRLALTPSKDYDDSYCLQYAHKKDAVIVSNDMYRDWVKKQPSWRKGESIQWLRTHVVSYTFVRDEFMPNPDFTMPEPRTEPPV